MTELEIRGILGQNVKKYRKVKKFSQEKLAEILDIAPNFLSDIENGKKWVSPTTMAKLTESLGVEAWQLFKGEQSIPVNVSMLLGQFAGDALEMLDKYLRELRDYYKNLS
ncbi:MAG: helix-turn-helix domain-containing protein [Treponema sp.]|jgi:transcriptional regulator with XRE-family HTH domain|nr:helix-turn-helix domain-containing protein [Treponema sp.]